MIVNSDLFKEKLSKSSELKKALRDFSPEPLEVVESAVKDVFYFLYGENTSEPADTYLSIMLKEKLERFTEFSNNHSDFSVTLLIEALSQTPQDFYQASKKLSFYTVMKQFEKIIKIQNPMCDDKAELWKHIDNLQVSKEDNKLLHQVREIRNNFVHNEYEIDLQEEKLIFKALRMLVNTFDFSLEKIADFNFEVQSSKIEKLISEKQVELKDEEEKLSSLKKDKESSKKEKKRKLLDSAISLHKKRVKEIKNELKDLLEELENISNQKSSFLSLHKKFMEDQSYFDDYYLKLKSAIDIFGTISNLSGVGDGWSLTKGALHNKEFLNLLKYSNLLQELNELQKLAKTLGRMKYSSDDFDMENILYKEIVVEKKRKLSSNSKDEVKGIYQSSDIHRVMPSELIYLANPETENIFYSKMFENKLLSYELQGYEDEVHQREIEKEKQEKKAKKERGPIIVNIDTSGSMKGVPEEVAKALTLAMVKTALKEDRECYLITFSSTNQTIEYELTKGDGALNNLMDFLLKSFGGGTDFETPLNRSLEILKRDNFSKSDILFVTDGYAGITSEMSEKLKSAKKENNFKITTVIVGSEVNKDKFSDKIVNFKNI
jgi:uncharacterized protein with von Willebrand factor type A (vWA) domain